MSTGNRWFVGVVGCVVVVGGLVWSLSGANSSVQAAENAAVAKVKPTDTFSAPFETVAADITPSLVSIISTRKVKIQSEMPQLPEEFRHFFGDDFFGHHFSKPPHESTEEALGSGFVIGAEGHILTNAHVVDDAEKVTVRLADNRVLQAKVIGKDSKTDLAVLKVNAANLTPAKLGDSDAVEAGEWVVAAGIPFGLSRTITAGVISAKGRSHVGITAYEDFIQTDAAINPGNSGGPLVNLKGEVIGINTAIFTQSGGSVGIGFAIPINMAKSIVHSLITTGHVVRGFLGVAIQDLTPELAKSFNYKSTEGVLVGDVMPDSPASKAEMKQGDIITEYEGQKVTNTTELREKVAETKPGTEVAVIVFRDGKDVTLHVKIGELKTGKVAAETKQSSAELGMTVKDLTPELAKQLGYENRQGVVVTEVDPGGLAATVGIQPHDLITKVQNQPVTNVDEFRKLMAKQDLKKGIRMVVRSGSTERFVFLQAGE